MTPRDAERGGDARRVVVSAPARLHFGFLDLNGSLNRRYGSLGMTLEQPRTVVELRRLDAGRSSAVGADAGRARRYVERLLEQLALPGAVAVTVRDAIPAHAGLGSGTQLALAVGVALARLYDLDLGAAEIASRLGRGARSGIGVGAFEHGGFLLDGGHRPEQREAAAVPPLVCRLPVADDWRLLLLFDDDASGVHGSAERLAFDALPPFSDELAGRLSRLTLLQLLPALVEHDADAFGQGVSTIQRAVGDYFAPHQGGRRFSSAVVSAALDWLLAHGAAGGGQSSWGPTGFALCADPDRGERLRAATRRRFPTLRTLLCRPDNRPARIAAFDSRRP